MMAQYHRLSVAEKRAASLARMREPAVSCPGGCGMLIMPADLLAHLEERCPGQRDPGPGAKWITWREALALGVPKMTLSRWARRGDVRTRGDRGDRRYLAGDLAVLLARRVASRRR